MPACFGAHCEGPPQTSDSGFVTFGWIYILVDLPPGLRHAPDFRLGGRSLTASGGDEGANRVEISAHGSRSTELLSAVARLEEQQHISVTVRASAPPPSATSSALAGPPALPDGVALLALELQLPVALWSYDDHRVRRWLGRQHKAAVTILGAIIPAGLVEAGDASDDVGASAVRTAVEDLLEQQPPEGDRERYSLISCFRELPSLTKQYDTRDGCEGHQYHRHGVTNGQRPQRASVAGAREISGQSALAQGPCGRHQPVGACGAEENATAGPSTTGQPGGCPILQLPPDVLEAVMSWLAPLDLARLRATCTALADAGAAGGAVPGVRLTLFPHQRAAICWMIRREKPSCQATRGSLAHPAQHPASGGQCTSDDGPQSRSYSKEVDLGAAPTQPHHHQQQHQHHTQATDGGRNPLFLQLLGGGLELWGDVCNGELRTTPPPHLSDVRGGFFCDEPGLGKTITALSLVLKTLGQLPSPPSGATVKWVPNREGRKVGFYTTGGGAPAGSVTEDPRAADPTAAPDIPGSAAHAATRRSARRSAAEGRAAVAAATAQRQDPQQPQLQPGESPRAPESPAGRKRSRLAAAGGLKAAQATGPDAGVKDEEEQEDGDEVAGKRRSRGLGRAPARAAGGGRGGGAIGVSPAAGKGRSGGTPSRTSARAAGGNSSGRSHRPKRKRARWSDVWESTESERDGGDDDDEEEEEELEEEEVEVGEEEAGTSAGAASPAAARLQRGGRSREAVRANGRAAESSREEDVPGSISAHDDDDGDDSDDGDFRTGGGRRRRGRGRGRSRGGASRRDGGGGSRGGGGGAKGSRGSQGAARGAGKGTGSGADPAGSGGAGDGSSCDDGDDQDDGSDALWVQCEQCQTWRRLPKGSAAPAGDDPWFCHMHPLPEAASCTAPREAYGAGVKFEEAPGYFRPGEAEGAAGGSERNVKYWEGRLRRVAARVGLDARQLAELRALSWLAQQKPAALQSRGSGTTVPMLIRRLSPGYETVFTEMDLVTVAGTAGRGGGRRGGGGKGRAAPPASAQHTWRAAPYMDKLLIDVEALREALATLRSDDGSEHRTTYLSAATLVVLPETIIDHWLTQIRTHVARGALRVCVLDRLDPRTTPDPSSLAWDYDVVITTFKCLSFGHVPGAAAGLEAAVGGGGAAGGGRGRRKGGHRNLGRALQQVHWLRIILDEGHLLGATTAITNRLQAACRLKAERRWVMTGTPSPATQGSSAAHLQPLLAFLHHQPYGTNAAAWQAAVQRPLDGCRPEGRRRLMRLLRDVMIRACKADLVLLPPLIRKVALLDFEPQHARSYNELVEVVRRNLLTSDWCDDAHSESLLNSSNSKWSRQMMNNVWFSCCVAGSTNSVVKEEDLLETLQLLAERLGLPAPGAELLGGVAVGPPWLAEVHPLKATEEALRHGTVCQVCAEHVRQPMVTPCGHLACLDCTAADRERCPLPSCRTPYRMQAVDDAARFKHNKKPKWPVPQELIEWQPVYHQQDAVGIGGGNWSPTWQLTRSSKISHMLARLREVGAAPPVHPDPPLLPHPPAKPRHTQSQLDRGASQIEERGVGSEDGEASASPGAALAADPHGCTGNGDGDVHASGAGGSGGGGGGGSVLVTTAPRRFVVQTKAIIFTQYGVHMQLIESSLMKADIPFVLLTQVIGKELREASLSRFQHDPTCGVLVMDQLGAVGLDLSFASYVLLMEPLTDFSMEQQVVSRAHRMGARKPVVVETLVMRGSAEEALLRLDRKGLRTQPTALAAAAAAARAGGAGAAGGSGAGGASTSRPSGNDAGGSGNGAVHAARPRELKADDPWVGEDQHHEDAVQLDRRALRNQLFLLMEKVRLDSCGAGRSGGGSNRGGSSNGEGTSGSGSSSAPADASRSANGRSSGGTRGGGGGDGSDSGSGRSSATLLAAASSDAGGEALAATRAGGAGGGGSIGDGVPRARPSQSAAPPQLARENGSYLSAARNAPLPPALAQDEREQHAGCAEQIQIQAQAAGPNLRDATCAIVAVQQAATANCAAGTEPVPPGRMAPGGAAATAAALTTAAIRNSVVAVALAAGAAAEGSAAKSAALSTGDSAGAGAAAAATAGARAPTTAPAVPAAAAETLAGPGGGSGAGTGEYVLTRGSVSQAPEVQPAPKRRRVRFAGDGDDDNA